MFLLIQFICRFDDDMVSIDRRCELEHWWIILGPVKFGGESTDLSFLLLDHLLGGLSVNDIMVVEAGEVTAAVVLPVMPELMASCSVAAEATRAEMEVAAVSWWGTMSLFLLEGSTLVKAGEVAAVAVLPVMSELVASACSVVEEALAVAIEVAASWGLCFWWRAPWLCDD
jgi:hypothetical protein